MTAVTASYGISGNLNGRTSWPLFFKTPMASATGLDMYEGASLITPIRARALRRVNVQELRTVGSFGSTPLMAFRINAQSSTDRAIGPILSRVHELAIAP